MEDDARRAGLRTERTQASAQWADGKFHNPGGISTKLEGGSWSLFGEYLFKGNPRRPPGALPLERPHETWAAGVQSNLRVTWLGHSTVLLELDGRRVLTDPVFAPRIGPARFIGPKRFHPVPAQLAELPELDAVLISHDHFDHLCRPTALELAKLRVPIVTSLGVGAHLERFGIEPARITELDWHESAEVGGVHFTAAPAQHFSGRGAGGRDRTLWSSWVIRGERTKVFFSGDTGLTPSFADTGRRYGPFDLVMLEVGAWHPAWGTIHLGPANALEAFAMLGGGTLLPVHWGTFNLALHDWNEPAETLVTLAAERGARVITPRLGRAFEPAHVDEADAWWRGVTKPSRRA